MGSFVVVCLFVCCEEIFCIMQANAENEFKLEDQEQVEKLAEESRNRNFCRKNLKAIIGVSVLSLCLIILGGLIYWKFFVTPALPLPPGYGYYPPPPAPPPAPPGYGVGP